MKISKNWNFFPFSNNFTNQYFSHSENKQVLNRKVKVPAIFMMTEPRISYHFLFLVLSQEKSIILFKIEKKNILIIDSCWNGKHWYTIETFKLIYTANIWISHTCKEFLDPSVILSLTKRTSETWSLDTSTTSPVTAGPL